MMKKQKIEQLNNNLYIKSDRELINNLLLQDKILKKITTYSKYKAPFSDKLEK